MGASPSSPVEVRIARAAALAERFPPAAELLHFYQRLANLQREVTGRSVDEFLDFTARVANLGNPQATANARALLKRTDHDELLHACWEGEHADFFARAFLQPSAEALNADCPWCRKRPQVSVLRDAAQGARRTLACGLCSREWNYPRIQCPFCQEQDFDTLPVFTAEEYPHLRIEACDSCQSYLLAVDMTKDGLAVPLVDELAGVTLHLWAQEQGYARRLPNLLGI